MNAVKLTGLLLTVMIFFACEKENKLFFNKNDKTIGCWVNPITVDTLWKYTRAKSLKDNDYGFIFYSDQRFVERKNAGWCGTPPISYADFDGTWSKKDSVIDITVKFWGGLADYQWKVISVDDNNLAILKLKEVYRPKI